MMNMPDHTIFIDKDDIQRNEGIFHPEMELSSPNSEKIFLNFTKIEKDSLPDDPEDRITTFLFKDERNFAQGHNCSVEWDQDDKDNKRSWVRTTFFPTYTVPEIKPREPTEEIKKLLDMRNLYEVQDSSKYKEILEPLVEKYSDWINERTKEKKDIDPIFVDDFDIPQHQIVACHPVFNWVKTCHSPIASCNILLILAYIWGYNWGYKLFIYPNLTII